MKIVEDVTGNKVTEENLAENIRKINLKRQALQRLYDLRGSENVPISGTDALLISQIAYYDDPERFTSMVNKLCDELEERIKNEVDVAKGAKRILLSGTPMAIPNWKLHNLVISRTDIWVLTAPASHLTRQELMMLSDLQKKQKRMELLTSTLCSVKLMISKEEILKQDARRKVFRSLVSKQIIPIMTLNSLRQELERLLRFSDRNINKNEESDTHKLSKTKGAG